MSHHPIYSRTGDRYLGNATTREVHDLIHEDASPSACQIDEIIAAGHAVGFSPDMLDQAHVEGYDNCSYCIGGSTR